MTNQRGFTPHHFLSMKKRLSLKNHKSGAGFTLVEVFIAIAVLTVGIGGVFALVYQTVSFGSNTPLRLTATYLSQEGLEVVRNIRDTNFLKIHKGQGGTWTSGLTGCTSGCEADYNDTALVVFANRFLKQNLGLYNYDSGLDSPFVRKITITQAGDILDVSVEVSWQERGRSHTVQAATKLYNWLTPTP